MTTNVPAPTFGAAGFVAPAELDVLTGVLADQNSAFGGNLNPSLTTPQGQIAQSLTAVIGDANNQFLALANGVDPAYASGRMQDAIGRIYYLNRIAASSTVTTALCTGAAGTVIPVNAQAQDQAGNIYLCTSGGTIPAGGSISLQFACATTGPISCPAGYLNTIYQAIPGWDSITNAAAGTPGRNVETRAEYELRRAQSVASNAVQIIQAIQGAVLAVPGVTDAYSYDNAGVAATVGGVALNANSIYVCVAGGLASDVAQAIWLKKGPGCGYTGSTSVTVYDTNSGYTTPYPSYTVNFQIPASLPFLFAVNMANSSAVPSNALTQIQTAIQTAFNGNDGGPRARIGSQLFASRFYAGIAALGPWAQIRSVLIGSTNTPSAVIVGSISGTTLTVGSVTSGTVAIGQSLFDASGSIIAGTTITAGSGTSWTVSATQTVASETITLAVAATNSQQANINQIPVLSSSNITLQLT